MRSRRHLRSAFPSAPAGTSGVPPRRSAGTSGMPSRAHRRHLRSAFPGAPAGTCGVPSRALPQAPRECFPERSRSHLQSAFPRAPAGTSGVPSRELPQTPLECLPERSRRHLQSAFPLPQALLECFGRSRRHLRSAFPGARASTSESLSSAPAGTCFLSPRRHSWSVFQALPQAPPNLPERFPRHLSSSFRSPPAGTSGSAFPEIIAGTSGVLSRALPQASLEYLPWRQRDLVQADARGLLRLKDR